MSIFRHFASCSKPLRTVLFCSFVLCSPTAWSQDAPLFPVQTEVVTAEPIILIAESDVLITMRDGINIAVDIYRPETPGQYPTLYAAAPYPHNDNSTVPNNALTGPVAWYVSHGYNYVLASTRGTGLSEGAYDLLSRNEQQDHYEVIEWIASQEWSNGKVAGVGASYYATAQWQMAIQNPPHLECIAPYNGVVQPYQDWAFPGGLASTTFTNEWYKQSIREANAFPASGPARIVDYDLDLQLLLHPSYDDYWRLRTSLENINEVSVPTFIMRDWNQAEPGLVGTFKVLENINSTNKLLLLNEPNEKAFYQNEEFLEQEVLAFYDWCLNDTEDSTFIEQARIRYYAEGQEDIKRDLTWPPGNTSPTPLFLSKQPLDESSTATLKFTAQENNISVSEYGVGTENAAITFISDVLEQDIEFVGAPSLELYASSAANDTAFAVTLSEQVILRQIVPGLNIPDFLQASILSSSNSSNATVLATDTDVIVSTGLLKASARGSVDEALLLTPNAVTRFDIALQPSAYRFERGNRIVIEIRQASDGSLTNKQGQDIIFHNSRYPSRLWLPMDELSRTKITVANDARNAQSASPEPELDVNLIPESEGFIRPEFDFLNTESLKDENANPIILIR